MHVLNVTKLKSHKNSYKEHSENRERRYARLTIVLNVCDHFLDSIFFFFFFWLFAFLSALLLPLFYVFIYLFLLQVIEIEGCTELNGNGYVEGASIANATKGFANQGVSLRRRVTWRC